MAISFKLLGLLLARMPSSFVDFLTEILSRTFMFLPSKRRRLLVSNLSHAFPSWSESRITRIAVKSSSRMLEMGFFSLAYPFFSSHRRKHSLLYPREIEAKLQELRDSGRPVVFLLPHLSLFETLATSPFFRPGGGRSLGAVYRPNRNPSIDSLIDHSRKATGLVTFSRKEGLLKAKKHLAEGNWLVILFDQNAGDRGTLGLFFDRLISFTTLPSLLCRSSGAIPVFAFPERHSTFRAKLELREIDSSSSDMIPRRAHELLEEKIRRHPEGLPEWLWSHGKWKVQSRPESRFRISIKRNSLSDLDSLPRKNSFCIRMPNWLGDVMMCLPLIRALRKGRPEVKITLIAKPHFIALLQSFSLADDFMELPDSKGLSYFLDFRNKCPALVECYLLFTNSLRGDVEALLSGSPQRFGLILPGRRRPLLTHSMNASSLGLESVKSLHQTELWKKMMAHFGLLAEVSSSPLTLNDISRQRTKVGIIAGSSNNPSKRWPAGKWAELISTMIAESEELEVILYGTSEDHTVSQSIMELTGSRHILDLTGKTSLPELRDELASCGLIIGNDTGGVHLANALGTPVIVLCGPTNPIATGPFFDAPLKCIQPENCPAQGGASIDSLSSTRVYGAVLEITRHLQTS